MNCLRSEGREGQGEQGDARDETIWNGVSPTGYLLSMSGKMGTTYQS